MKKFRSIYIFILTLCIILSNVGVANALPYYDLKFEKISENIVKGEFEKITNDTIVTDADDMTMVLDKKFKAIIDIDINKDEEDAIGYALGANWNEGIMLDKNEELKRDITGKSYIMVRPVYKEIKGELVQDYISWSKKKEITIKIPIDIEYTFKNIK